MLERNDKGNLIENDYKMNDKMYLETQCSESKDKDNVNAQQSGLNMEELDLNMSSKEDKHDTKGRNDVPGDTNTIAEKDHDKHKPNGSSRISSEESLNKERKSLSGRLLSITSKMSSTLSRMKSITSRQLEPKVSTVGKTQYLKQAHARKMAFQMFCISLAFVLSYVPHLLLMLMRALKDDFIDNMSDTGRALYKFFLRSYFLQCMINPIIYAACASRFRRECKKLFNSLCGRAETE